MWSSCLFVRCYRSSFSWSSSFASAVVSSASRVDPLCGLAAAASSASLTAAAAASSASLAAAAPAMFSPSVSLRKLRQARFLRLSLILFLYRCCRLHLCWHCCLSLFLCCVVVAAQSCIPFLVFLCIGRICCCPSPLVAAVDVVSVCCRCGHRVRRRWVVGRAVVALSCFFCVRCTVVHHWARDDQELLVHRLTLLQLP